MSIFEFHTGQKAEVSGSQSVMQCPWCDKEKFYYNDQNLWDCKVCGIKGNAVQFLALLLESSDKRDLRNLNKKRGIPTRILEHNNVRFNTMNDTWLIPTYRLGKLNNVYKYVESSNVVYCSPGMTGTLFNWDEVTEETIWLCEGQWDKMAAEAILLGKHPISAVSVPGANVFKETWIQYFSGKNVVICYDNDEPGKKGMERVIQAFAESSQKPTTLSYIKWPEDKKNGYDLRDCYNEYRVKSYDFISELITPISNQQATRVEINNVIEDPDCNTIEKALEAFETCYYTTDDMAKTLILTIASIYSIKFEGMEQLWLKIIGPPSSGKTSIAKAVSGSDQVVTRSTFTGLFSGWMNETGSDVGLIPEIAGKTLIVKDADALLQQPNVAQIFSEMRDFYDKESSVQYRTGVKRDYKNIKSTFIICGTQALRGADQSFLGERFLSVEIDVNRKDKNIISNMAMQKFINAATTQNSQDTEKKMLSSIKGFINNVMERKMESTIPKAIQQIIIELCTLAALMRASVHRDRTGKLLSPPIPELPIRLIGQITSATFATCVVLGKSQADGDVLKLINKLIRDTINPRGFRYKICEYLTQNPDAGAQQIAEALDISRSRFDDEMLDLKDLGLVSATKVKSLNTVGAKRFVFALNDEVKNGFLELNNG